MKEIEIKKLFSVVSFIAQSVISSMTLFFSYIYGHCSQDEFQLQQEREELKRERELFKEACRNVKNCDEFIELMNLEIHRNKTLDSPLSNWFTRTFFRLSR